MIEALEIGLLAAAFVCIVYIIGLTLADYVDYHYSKKRGEIE